MANAKPTYIPIVTKYDPAGINQAEGAFDKLRGSLGKIAGAIAAAFTVRAVVDFAKESISAAEAVQEANNRIGAIAESMSLFGAETEAVSNRLIEFAESKELQLGVDAELIKAGQAQLLTFKNLAETADETGGMFDRATVASADLAAAGFGSIDSASIMLGKALNDPIKGITALGRAGVQFTEEQKGLIKSLVDTGDIAKAQELILAEVETQVGGTAEATATASEKIALAFGNIKEEAGAALLPLFEQLAPVLIGFASQIGPVLAEAFTALGPVLTQIIELLPGLLSSITPLIPIIGELAGTFLELVALVLPPLANLLVGIAPIVVMLADAFLQFITAVLEPLMPLFTVLINAMMPMITSVLEPLIAVVLELVPVLMDFIMSALVPLIPIVLQLISAFLPIISSILPMFGQLVLAVLPPLMQLLNEVLMPLINIVLDLALSFAPIIEKVLPVFLQLAIALLPVLVQLLTAILIPMIPTIEFLAGVITFLVGVLADGFVWVVETLLIPALEFLQDIFENVLPPAIEFFQGVFEDMGTKFEEVGAFLEEIWGGFGDFFKGVANNIIGFFEGFLNFVIDGVNNFFVFLDDMGQGLRDISGGTLGWDVEFRIPNVSLPRLAEGGIVMPQAGGVLAMLAEAGQPEVVIPLDRLNEFGSGGGNIQITINAGVGTDPVSVGRAVVNAIKRYESTSGRVFLAG